MSVDARREQMLDVGIVLLAGTPLEEISIDDIVAKAEISRALFYHYFESKSQYFRQAVERASNAISDATRPDPEAPPGDQLKYAIDGYLDFVTDHSLQYRAIYRSLQTGDPAIRQILVDSQSEKEEQILAVLGEQIEISELVRLAVHGWIAFLIANCLRWLDTGEPERDQLRDMCTETLFAAVAAAVKQG